MRGTVLIIHDDTACVRDLHKEIQPDYDIIASTTGKVLKWWHEYCTIATIVVYHHPCLATLEEMTRMCPSTKFIVASARLTIDMTRPGIKRLFRTWDPALIAKAIDELWEEEIL